MLKKDERLKDRRLFNLTFSRKKKLYSRFLTLYYLENKRNITNTKTAFVVGTAVDKRASKRNLFKRRMREAYENVKKRLPNISVLIWAAKNEVKDATFILLKDEMKSMIEKLERTRVLK